MTTETGDSRRGFLAKVAAVACGGLATLAPVAAGVWAFLDPLRRKGSVATFLPVTELSAIPDDGVPRQFAVIADRIDAWTGRGASAARATTPRSRSTGGSCNRALRPGRWIRSSAA
ncbi:MAG: hypothetical protein EBX35_11645 [Planctomycetia bacterium]|nr:hypothetical protein [Planctomycetia bacterium]